MSLSIQFRILSQNKQIVQLLVIISLSLIISDMSIGIKNKFIKMYHQVELLGKLKHKIKFSICLLKAIKKWLLTPTDPGVLSYLKTRGRAFFAPPEVSGFLGSFGVVS